MASMSDSLFAVNSMDLRASWRTISVVEWRKTFIDSSKSLAISRFRGIWKDDDLLVKIGKESTDSGFIEKSCEIIWFHRIFGTPDTIRTCDLQRRSFQAVTDKMLCFQGLYGFRRDSPSFLNDCKTIENTGQTGFWDFADNGSQTVVKYRTLSFAYCA